MRKVRLEPGESALVGHESGVESLFTALVCLVCLVSFFGLTSCRDEEPLPSEEAEPCERRSDAAYVRTVNDTTGTPAFWGPEALEECVSVLLDPEGTPDFILPGLEEVVLRAAIGRWQAVADGCGAALCLRYGGLASASETLPRDAGGLGLNGVSFIPTSEQWEAEYGASAIALTFSSIRASDGQILSADIVLNDEPYLFSNQSPTPAGALDLESVFVHELGHLLGFDHSVDPGSIMREGPVTARAGTPIGEVDEAGVCEVFGCY